jgi:hypothetical protein
MTATTKLCKEGLMRLAALLDKLPAAAEINRASSEWNGAEVLLSRGLDEVAAAYNLEISERRFEYEDSSNIQRMAVLDGIALVQIVPVREEK